MSIVNYRAHKSVEEDNSLIFSGFLGKEMILCTWPRVQKTIFSLTQVSRGQKKATILTVLKNIRRNENRLGSKHGINFKQREERRQKVHRTSILKAQMTLVEKEFMRIFPKLSLNFKLFRKIFPDFHDLSKFWHSELRLKVKKDTRLWE